MENLKAKKPITAILLLIFLMAGCIDEITFDTERTGNQLVVNGKITDGPGPYYLELGMTSDKSVYPRAIENAIVTLFDDNGNHEVFSHSEEGLYILPGNVVNGKRGQSYHLEIELSDGKLYTSIPEMIPVKNGTTEALAEVGVEQVPSASGRPMNQPAVFIFANTQLPDLTSLSEPLFLKWDVESVYSFLENVPASPLAPPPNTCYISEVTDPQVISLFASNEAGSIQIQRKPLAVKRVVNHHEFYRRHYFNVILSSITERRYHYWRQVDQVINQSGTIFDVPPATVRGNIFNTDDENDFALGYFEAAAVDTSHAFVTRGDFSFSILDPCPQMGSVCDNCLELENSSLDRPPYF